MKRTINAIQKFIQLETSSGILLFVFAVLALILDNSAYSEDYRTLLNTPLTFQLGQFILSKSLQVWVNDALMVIFFLLVGMEIKREMVEGELNSMKKVALPGIAALGGMTVPALIFVSINWNHPEYLNGWAIPTATDIAFSLGVLSLLGKRVPVSLKVFLTALAILDDLGAIIIIAFFYSHELSYISLLLAAVCTLILILMNLFGIKKLSLYSLVGVVLWFCILKSGIHATIAGVILAMTIPLKTTDNRIKSPLHVLEQTLHPWVAFLILPIFGFFNSGVSFDGINLNTVFSPLTLGIGLGLFFGKQIGILGFAWTAVKLNIAKMPHNSNWVYFYGIALICGIGFTMSLFIATLAFPESEGKYALLIRLGVLGGSALSGLVGYLFLLILSSKKPFTPTLEK